MSYFVTCKRVERSQGLIFFSIYKAPCHCDGFALSQKEEKTSRKRGQIPDIMTLKETIT